MMADGIQLKLASEEYGTPSFLFDIEEFQTRMRKIRALFGPKVKLCFAMKANPFLIVPAAETAERLEVCSPGELDLCIRAGILPNQIVYSGVNKQAADIETALRYGVDVVTAESSLQVQLINSVASQLQSTARVLLRLNAGSQFGMSRSDLLSIIGNRAAYANLHFAGIHYFVGTQRRKLKHQAKELAMLSELIESLHDEYSFEVQRLEYGPGLAVPYFEDDDFTDTLAPARELTPLIAPLAERTELTVEMGRFFAASCGAYLSRVVDIKENEGVRYAILDGGMNHLTYSGQMMGMHTPIIENLSHCEAGRADGTCASWCLCGSLCTVNDVIARDAQLADLQLNDILAFRHAGAYSVTEGVNLFLSRTMPRIIWRNADGHMQMVRDFLESSAFNEVQPS